MRWLWAAFALFCAEVVALVEFGRQAGALRTLALVLLMSLLGAALLRAEGAAFIARLAGALRREVEEGGTAGDVPPGPIAEAAPRFVAGALFLLPGFVSDALAIAALLPPLNGRIRRRVQRFLEENEARRRAARARARDGLSDLDVEAETIARWTWKGAWGMEAPWGPAGGGEPREGEERGESGEGGAPPPLPRGRRLPPIF